MPTTLDRIQVLLQPDTYAKVMTLMNVTGKTRSNLASDLIEHALNSDKYRELLSQADDAQTVKPKDDPRTESRRGSYHRQPSAKTELVSDGKGGLIDPTLSEDDNLHIELSKAQQARPVMSQDEYHRVMRKVWSGEMSQEQALEMLSFQTPAPGQSKDEKQMEMRGELLQAIGEQDERIKRMEEMMAKIAAKL